MAEKTSERPRNGIEKYTISGEFLPVARKCCVTNFVQGNWQLAPLLIEFKDLFSIRLKIESQTRRIPPCKKPPSRTSDHWSDNTPAMRPGIVVKVGLAEPSRSGNCSWRVIAVEEAQTAGGKELEKYECSELDQNETGKELDRRLRGPPGMSILAGTLVMLVGWYPCLLTEQTAFGSEGVKLRTQPFAPRVMGVL